MIQPGTSHEIDLLLSQLASGETVERLSARSALVERGADVTASVAKLAESKVSHQRWECAKILAEIADESSVDALILLLEDPEEGTRWDAALGLIAIGKPSVDPLLRAIIRRSTQYTIFASARHVMHSFSQTQWGSFLGPLYESLNSTSPRECAPVEAYNALQKWESGGVVRRVAK